MTVRYSLPGVRFSLIALIIIFAIQASSSEEINANDKLIATNQKQFSANVQSEQGSDAPSAKGASEIENKFQTNEKVSVIISTKNQETMKKFDFKSNSVAFGANSFSTKDFEIKNKFSTINAFSAEITKETYEKLKANSELRIEYDYPMHAFLRDSTLLVNATRTWAAMSSNLNITGKGQAICILDTGLNYSHVDLGGCSAGSFSSGSCAKVPSGWDFVNSDADPYDDNGHGTHVAGIAAASGGIRGVAPDAKIIPIKVLGALGTGSESNIISGVDWCVNNATKFNITVISMSLGTDVLYSGYCESSFTAFANSIANAIAKNITVVAATGNDGSSTQIASPACIQNATAVGATTKTDTIATSYSNRNNLTDLLAPGSTINSTNYNGAYSSETGTSMATPHVAGAIALLQQFANLELRRNFTANETQTYLQGNGKTISESGVNYKRIDVIQTLISFDTKAPSLVLNTPANNSIILRGIIINLNISDNILLNTILYSRNNGSNTSSGSGQISTAGWPDGNVTLNVFVNDSAGNSNSSAYIFAINNSAPLASSVALLPAIAYTNDTLRCNYTYSDANSDAENGTLVQWFVNNAVNLTFENQTTINASFTEKNQAWMCSIKPRDGIEFGVQVNSTNITIQNFPLVVNYTTLSAGKVSGSITINATVFDIDTSDVDVVNFYFQNATQTTFIANDTASPYSISWNTSTTGDGNYTILVNATDGEASANRTIANVFVDNNRDAPVVAVTSPNGGESWSGTKTITWTASDPDYDALNFTVYYSADGGKSWTIVTTASETSFNWNTATVSNGAGYRINVTAADGTFNVSDISNSNFTISNSAGNSGSGSGGGGGDVGGGLAGSGKPDPNRASFLFPEVKAGQSQSLSISGKSAIPITEIEFTTSSDALNAKVIVKKADSATGKPAGEVYSHVEIETENLENKISSAKINFKIDDGWLKSNSINKNSIALYRHAGSWQKLETIMTANDGIYARFTAKSPGFSTFAIAGEKLPAQTQFSAQEKKEEKAEERKEETPAVTGSAAFAGALTKSSVVYAAIILLLLAIPFAISFKFGLLKRRKSKQNDPYQAYKDYYAEYQRRYMLWYKRAAKVRAMGAPTPAAQKRKFRLNLGGMQEKFRGLAKWLFTDTKAFTEQQKAEKSKKKERPDFGF